MPLKTLIAKYPKSKYAIFATQKIASYDLEAIYKARETNKSSVIFFFIYINPSYHFGI